MTWTYAGDPSANDRDAVRHHCGDVDTKDQQLSDEEIAYILTRNSDVVLAAAEACEAIAARVARDVSRSNLGSSKSLSEKLEHFKCMADKLRESINIGGLEVFAGGLTKSGKRTLSEDNDAVQPEFSVGMDDRPGTNVNNLRSNFDRS